MELYEGIKDAIGIAQKADNIELYRQLLDLGNQALDMQAEIARLKEENETLRKANDLESRIIRHEKPFITLQDENEKICYCAICWGNQSKLIQMNRIKRNGRDTLQCNICKTICLEKNSML